MTLLSHYYQPDTEAAVIRAAATDWLDILSPFPQGAISEACREYLRSEAKVRPTPGAIRALAVKAMEADKRLAPSLPPPERLRLTEAPRERVTPEAAARILAEAGLTPTRIAAVMNGRRMPRPGRPLGEPEPADEPPAYSDAPRPYTDAERARMARLRPQPPQEEAQA